MRKIMSALAGALLCLVPLSLTAGPASAATHPGAAPDDSTNDGAHECLYNSRDYCLDLKDNHFAQHQPVWMYDKNHANALGWQTFFEEYVGSSEPFTTKSLDTKYKGDAVYILYKTGHGGLRSGYCLGETSGNVVLDNHCAGTYGDWWVKDGNDLINVLRSDYEGGTRELVTAYPTDDEPVKVGTSNGNYHQWDFKTCCSGLIDR
jgi:hypothetical protein